MTVNLFDDSPIQKKIDQLYYLTRESMKREQITELWRQAGDVTEVACSGTPLGAGDHCPPP